MTTHLNATIWISLGLAAGSLASMRRRHEPRGMSRAPLPRAGLDMWPAGGAFVALLLLLAFALVVREGVRQGNARRQTHALLAEATWRCQALAAPGQRAACRTTYDLERPADSDGVRALVAAVSDPR